MGTNSKRLHIHWEEQDIIAAIIDSMTSPPDHRPLPMSRNEWVLFPQTRDGGEWIKRFRGLELEDVGGEGHCQFRALAEVLLGDRKRYREVRRAAAEWIQAHRGNFDGVAQHDVPASSPRYDSLQDFVEAIEHGAEWGNHATLQAISDSWKVEIRVVSSMNGGTVFNPIVPSDGSDDKRFVYVAHYVECHYAVIRVKNSEDGDHMDDVPVHEQPTPPTQVSAMPSPAVLPGVFGNPIYSYLECTDNALQACQNQETKRIEIDHIMKNDKVDAVVFGDTGCGMDETSLRSFAIAAHHPGFQQAEEPTRSEASAHRGRFVNYDLGVYGVGAKRCAFYMGNLLYVFTKKDGGPTWRLQMDYNRMKTKFDAGERESDPEEAERLKTEAWRLDGLNSVSARKLIFELSILGVSESTQNNFLSTSHGTLVIVNNLNAHFDFANDKNTDDVVAEILNSYGPTYIAQEKVQFIVDEHEIPISPPTDGEIEECYKRSFFGCLPPDCRDTDAFTFSIKPTAMTTVDRQVNVVAMYYPRRWSEEDKQILPTAPWSSGPQYYVYYNGRLVHDAQLIGDSNPPILPGIAHVRDRRVQVDEEFLDCVAFYFFVTSGYTISQDKSSIADDMSWIWDPKKTTYDHPRNPKTKFWEWAKRCSKKYDNTIDMSGDESCKLNGKSIKVGDTVVLCENKISRAVVVRRFQPEHGMMWFTHSPYFRRSTDFEKELERQLMADATNLTSKALVFKINTNASGAEVEQLKQTSDTEVRSSWPTMVVADTTSWDEWLAGRNRDNYGGFDIPAGGDVEMVAGQTLTLPCMSACNSTGTSIRKSLVLGGLIIKAVLIDGADDQELKVNSDKKRKDYLYIEQRQLTTAGEFTVEARIESSLGYPVSQEPLALKWNVIVRVSEPDILVTEYPRSGVKLAIGGPVPDIEAYFKDKYGNRIELDEKRYIIQPDGFRVEDGVVVGTFDDGNEYELTIQSNGIESDPIPLKVVPGPAQIQLEDVPVTRRYYHGVAYTINGKIVDAYGNALRQAKVIAKSEHFMFKKTRRHGMTDDKIDARVEGCDFELDFVPLSLQPDRKAKALMKLSVPEEECEIVIKILLLPVPKLRLLSVPDGLERIGTGDGSTEDQPLVLAGRVERYSLECECENSREWAIRPDSRNISIVATERSHKVVASFQDRSGDSEAVLHLLLKPKGGKAVRLNLLCPAEVIAGDIVDGTAINALDRRNLESTYEAGLRYTWASDDEVFEPSDECRAPKEAGQYSLLVTSGRLESNKVIVDVIAGEPRLLWTVVHDDHGEERVSGCGKITAKVYPNEKLTFRFEVLDEYDNQCTENVTRNTVELASSPGIHGYRGSTLLGKPSTHTIEFVRGVRSCYGVFKSPIRQVQDVRVDFHVIRDEVSNIRMDEIQPKKPVDAGENNFPADLSSDMARLKLILENGEERVPKPDSVKLLLYEPNGHLQKTSSHSMTKAGKYIVKVAYVENRPHRSRGTKTFVVRTIDVVAGAAAILHVVRTGIMDANNSGSPLQRLVVRPGTECELQDQYGNRCWNSSADLNVSVPGVEFEMLGTTIPLSMNRGATLLPQICVKERTKAGNYELQFTVDDVSSTPAKFKIVNTHDELVEAQRRREHREEVNRQRAHLHGLHDEMENNMNARDSVKTAIDNSEEEQRTLFERIKAGLERYQVTLPADSHPRDYVDALKSALEHSRRQTRPERAIEIPHIVQDRAVRLVDVMGVESSTYGNVLASMIGQRFNALIVQTPDDCRAVRRAISDSNPRHLPPTIFTLSTLPPLAATPNLPPPSPMLVDGRPVDVHLGSTLVHVVRPEYEPLRNYLFSRTIVLPNGEVERYREQTGRSENNRQILGFISDKILKYSQYGELTVQWKSRSNCFGNAILRPRYLQQLENDRVRLIDELPQLIERNREEIDDLEVRIRETQVRIDVLEEELRVADVQDVEEERPRRRQRR